MTVAPRSVIPDLDRCFSDREIIAQLVRLRLAQAGKTRRQLYRGRLSGKTVSGRPVDSDAAAITALFPPRRLWCRPYEVLRRKLPPDRVQAVTLLTTTLKLRKRPEYQDAPWAVALAKMIARIRDAIEAGPNWDFEHGKVIAIPGQGNVFRAVVSYPAVTRIVCGLLSKYLRDLLDPLYLDCAAAYRASRRTHHDAVAALAAFRLEHSGQRLWVAEYDIKGFFDALEHGVIRESFAQAAGRLAAAGCAVDPRAIRLFDRFIEHYAYEKDVLNRTGELLKAGQSFKGAGERPRDGKCRGIPQGNPLSVIVANLVLDRVDRSLAARENPDGQYLFYCRYCDDILIAHVRREKCAQAFAACRMALAELDLEYHAPVRVTTWPKTAAEISRRRLLLARCGLARLEKNGMTEFWQAKSKAPYCWSERRKDGHSPWVGFLGYQIRYDGLLRIRRESLARELARQNAETGLAICLVERAAPAMRPEKEAIRECFRRRQIARTVGYPQNVLRARRENHDVWPPEGPFWISGFRLANGQVLVARQLRKLDRGRERQFRRFDKALARIFSGETASAPRPVRKRKNDKALRLARYGHPFSYASLASYSGQLPSRVPPAKS